jgi:hypothetical protein
MIYELSRNGIMYTKLHVAFLQNIDKHEFVKLCIEIYFVKRLNRKYIK